VNADDYITGLHETLSRSQQLHNEEIARLQRERDEARQECEMLRARLMALHESIRNG
jgi:hypothetical protein